VTHGSEFRISFDECFPTGTKTAINYDRNTYYGYTVNNTCSESVNTPFSKLNIKNWEDCVSFGNSDKFIESTVTCDLCGRVSTNKCETININGEEFILGECKNSTIYNIINKVIVKKTILNCFNNETVLAENVPKAMIIWPNGCYMCPKKDSLIIITPEVTDGSDGGGSNIDAKTGGIIAACVIGVVVLAFFGKSRMTSTSASKDYSKTSSSVQKGLDDARLQQEREIQMGIRYPDGTFVK